MQYDDVSKEDKGKREKDVKRKELSEIFKLFQSTQRSADKKRESDERDI